MLYRYADKNCLKTSRTKETIDVKVLIGIIFICTTRPSTKQRASRLARHHKRFSFLPREGLVKIDSRLARRDTFPASGTVTRTVPQFAVTLVQDLMEPKPILELHTV